MPNAPEKIEFVTDESTGVAVPRLQRVLLVGGSHTGKTATLVSRVALMLEARGLRPERFTALTVRDESSEALRSRLAAHPEIGGRVNEMFVGTVDGLAACLMRSGEYNIPGLDPNFSVWDEETALDVMQMVLPEHPDLHSLMLTRADIRRVLRWYWRNRSKWPGDPQNDALHHYWPKVAALYRAEKSRQNAVDLYDLPAMMVQAIGNGPYGLKPALEHLFRFVVLDEAHELTPMQLHFLYSICDPNAFVVAALDPSQAIDWSADQKAETSLTLMFDMPTVVLSTARGRTQRLHEMSEALGRGLGIAGPEVVSHGNGEPEGTWPMLVAVEGTFTDMDNACLQDLTRLHGMGIPWEDMCVIDRGGRALGRMRTQLVHRGIPHRELGRVSGAGPTDARCLVALMTCVINSSDLAAIRIGGAPDHRNARRLLPDPTSRKLLELARAGGIDLIAAGEQLDAGADPNDQHRPLVTYLLGCTRVVTKWIADPTTELTDLFAKIQGLIYACQPAGLVPADEPEMALLEALWTETPHLPGQPRLAHLRRFLDRSSAALHPAWRHDRQEGVTFAAIDAARGRSWRFAALLDVSDESLPGGLSPTSPRLEREARRFHSALHRADERLFLYYTADTGRGSRTTPSRFLEPMRHLLEEVTVTPNPMDPFAEDVFADLFWGHAPRRSS